MEDKFEKLKRLLNENFDSKDMDIKISYKDSTPNQEIIEKGKATVKKIQQLLKEKYEPINTERKKWMRITWKTK